MLCNNDLSRVLGDRGRIDREHRCIVRILTLLSLDLANLDPDRTCISRPLLSPTLVFRGTLMLKARTERSSVWPNETRLPGR
jgi:hypothetical protein